MTFQHEINNDKIPFNILLNINLKAIYLGSNFGSIIISKGIKIMK